MSWIRMAIGAVAFCAVASAASAQGSPPDKQGGHGWGRGGSHMLFNSINLTDAQKQQIENIKDKYKAQMKALRPEGAGSGGAAAPGAQSGPGGRPQMSPELRAKLDEIRGKQNAEFRGVLTTAQQAIFDKNLAEMKARKDHRRPPSTN